MGTRHSHITRLTSACGHVRHVCNTYVHFKEHKRSGRAHFQKCCANSRELLPGIWCQDTAVKEKEEFSPNFPLTWPFWNHTFCAHLADVLPNLQQSLLDVRGFLSREPTSKAVTVCFTQNSNKQQLYLVCFPVSPNVQTLKPELCSSTGKQRQGTVC